MKIAFFLGSVDISGGSYVIYQHALFIKRKGHDVTIVALYPYNLRQLTWHPETHELRFLSIEQVGEERFDLAIATWWKTALELHRLNATQYAYFVQSIESRFYPENEEPLRNLVDSTYTLPIPGITEAVWIREYLASHYGRQYRLARNGIRKDLYTEQGPAAAARLPKGQLRVLVEGPFAVFFKNVGRTLKLARQAKPDETWLLTSSDVPWYPAVDRYYSRIPIDQVASVYRACDVIVKLSYVEGMFGPPLEMFHCGGTAIVYDVTGYEEYIVHERNALVIKQDDEKAVVAAIRRLRSESDLLARLRNGARETAAAWPDWNHASAVFLVALEDIMDQPQVSREAIECANRRALTVYTEEENIRLSVNPSKKIRYNLDAFRKWVPPKLARGIRLCRYILEGWL
jgi:glycosyltransferase involved in cell wall biosynthesis